MLSVPRTFHVKVPFYCVFGSVYACLSVPDRVPIPMRNYLAGFCLASAGDQEESGHFVHTGEAECLGCGIWLMSIFFWPTDLKCNVAFNDFSSLKISCAYTFRRKITLLCKPLRKRRVAVFFI